MPSFFRTLRFRIAAAFFFWTGLIQVALALFLPAAREVMVFDALDRRLQHAGDVIVAATEAGTRAPQDLIKSSIAAELDPASVQVSVRDADGNLLVTTGQETRQIPFSVHPGPAIAKVQYPGDEAERFRVANFVATTPTGAIEYIQTAASLRSSDEITATLRGMLWFGLSLGLVGAAAAGWIVSGLFTSRIDRVSRAVRSVSPTRLDERIDLPAGTDEIGRMAADVNQMLQRMAVAFRSQERFMSEVSHELKTPVSALLTEAQVLKQMRSSSRASTPGVNGSLQPVPESARAQIEPFERFVLSVEEEMRWLGKLVESFLMLARFGHGKQFVAETLVAINDVVLDAVEHSTLYARQHGVSLALTLYDPGESRPEAVIRGDAELLRVVADNLIRNAVQFSKRGDTVSVRVDLEADAPDTPGTIVFTVKDQGPGVPDEYLTRIFDRFAQAPGKQSTRRGSGLGLTIAKGVVDLHAGTIDARNSEQGGCIFRVRLPAYEPGPPSRIGAAAPASLASAATSSHQ